VARAILRLVQSWPVDLDNDQPLKLVELIAHAVGHAQDCFGGSRSGSAKLSEQQVLEVACVSDDVAELGADVARVSLHFGLGNGLHERRGDPRAFLRVECVSHDRESYNSEAICGTHASPDLYGPGRRRRFNFPWPSVSDRLSLGNPVGRSP